MSTFPEYDWTRLVNAFDERLSLAEQGAFEAWLRAEPERAAAVERLRLAWAVAGQTEQLTWDSAAMWAVVDPEQRSGRQIEERARPTSGTSAPHRRRPQRGRASRMGVIGVAACLAAIATVAVLRRVATSPASVPALIGQTFSTRVGQQAAVTLADGVVATLAPSTTLRVTSDVVTLTGEAYFTVSPRVERPFVVKTGNAMIRVLGTKFVVRQYPAERSSRIVVEDGRVALKALHPVLMQTVGDASGDAPIVLAARMLGQVSDSSIAVTQGIVVDVYTGWTEGRLVFDESPLHDVLDELARAYGVNIHLDDTVLAKHRVTAAVSVRKQPLAQVLDLVTAVADAHYTKTGQDFVVTSGRAAWNASPNQRFPQQEKLYGR